MLSLEELLDLLPLLLWVVQPGLPLGVGGEKCQEYRLVVLVAAVFLERSGMGGSFFLLSGG